MKYVYIELSTDLNTALYQLISAMAISKLQNAAVAINIDCVYKDTIFKQYTFKHIQCGNTFDENRQGHYNIYKVRYYKTSLKLIGQFKQVELFLYHIDDFINSLNQDGYEKEVTAWLNEVNNIKQNVIMKLNNSVCLYNNEYVSSAEHRGGWKAVIKNLFNNNVLSMNESNYTLIDMLDTYTDTKYSEKILNKKWFGMIHSTIFVPDHLTYSSVSDVITSKFFSVNKNTCLGLITFSSIVKNYIERLNLNIEILYVKHPINITDIYTKFDLHKFKEFENRKIILLGKQLRKISTIYMLNCPKYVKAWLPGTSKYTNYSSILQRELSIIDNKITLNSVNIDHYTYIPDYDDAICNHIIIVDLWDANANNSVLELLIRNTPFFVSKRDVIIEYLGPDYPMYFETIVELENMINGDEIELLYEKTHLYLKSIDTTDITYNYFNNKINKFFTKQINTPTGTKNYKNFKC